MAADPLPTDALLIAAADWHARAHAVPGQAWPAALRDWLDADPRHRLAFAEVCAVAYALEQQATAEAPHAQAVARPPRRWFARGAGVLLASLVLLLGWQGERPWDRLRSDAWTVEGEVRTLALPDGSRAWLGADSAIAWRFDGRRRELRLLRGEAFFDVRKEPARPFVVLAGALQARALGTRYGVAYGPRDAPRVEVEEGRVEVTNAHARLQLEAGAAARLAADGTLERATASRPATWRDGVLVFESATAAEVVATLDRYVPGRVVLLGASSTRISAAIASGDARDALLAIAAREGWRADGVPGVLLVLH